MSRQTRPGPPKKTSISYRQGNRNCKAYSHPELTQDDSILKPLPYLMQKKENETQKVEKTPKRGIGRPRKRNDRLGKISLSPALRYIPFPTTKFIFSSHPPNFQQLLLSCRKLPEKCLLAPKACEASCRGLLIKTRFAVVSVVLLGSNTSPKWGGLVTLFSDKWLRRGVRSYVVAMC